VGENDLDCGIFKVKNVKQHRVKVTEGKWVKMFAGSEIFKIL
jgi:hypothetical protein